SVAPGDDERDNIANVTPHAQFVGNAVYEYLPAQSRGTAVPTPAARVELVTVDLQHGAGAAFEAALAAEQPSLKGETLWYRMVAGGAAPRYLRLRPRASLAAIVDDRRALPDAIGVAIAQTTVEILNFRPTLSYGLTPRP